MASIFTGGNVPNRADGMWVIEQKILGAITDWSGSGSSSLPAGAGAVLHGNGPPVNPPPTTSLPWIYYDDDVTSSSYDVTWRWNVNSQAWIGA